MPVDSISAGHPHSASGPPPAAEDQRSRTRRDESPPPEVPFAKKTGSSPEEDPVKLSQEAMKLQELATRDREVRAHEAAHAAAGGGYAGSPRYSYETGPDGKRYAVGGEVSLSLSSVPGDPQATVMKMNRIKAAALAPADPSPTDHRIAALAAAKATQAQMEVAQQRSAALSAAGAKAVAQPESAPAEGEPATAYLSVYA